MQGNRCVAVQPIRGEEPVESIHDCLLPEGYESDEYHSSTGNVAPFGSAGTMDLQRSQTSVSFLYRDPERLSLVFVHGSVESSDKEAVTFRLAGLAENGGWIVRDDFLP